MQSLSSLLTIHVLSGGDVDRAQRLSREYQLTLLEGELSAPIATPYALVMDEGASRILSFGKGAAGPVTASFLDGKSVHRMKFGGGKGQLIAKAVGVQSGIYPNILDATAGLGKDAFVLATLGCSVTMMERSPIVSELLFSALAEASTSEVSEITRKMALQTGSSVEWLESQSGFVADVIYLDPMYPHRDKSSLVKKEMRVFQDLVGKDDDSSELLEAAILKAEYRVAVKRPRKGEKVAGPEPSYQLMGKSSRYDIYTNKAITELKGRN